MGEQVAIVTRDQLLVIANPVSLELFTDQTLKRLNNIIIGNNYQVSQETIVTIKKYIDLFNSLFTKLTDYDILTEDTIYYIGEINNTINNFVVGYEQNDITKCKEMHDILIKHITSKFYISNEGSRLTGIDAIKAIINELNQPNWGYRTYNNNTPLCKFRLNTTTNNDPKHRVICNNVGFCQRLHTKSSYDKYYENDDFLFTYKNYQILATYLASKITGIDFSIEAI
jgi:hypothetical protein